MKLGRKSVGVNQPTYFIADIASNHDGDLERAKKLVLLAAEAGADAVKFQHFRADTIVSDDGFQGLGGKIGHQSDWGDSVYNTYKKYEVPMDWTQPLADLANSVGCDFLTTPYDLSLIPGLVRHVCAWKVGSGDITYKQLIQRLVTYNKPLLLATGASTDEDIKRALGWTDWQNVILMQCNTNYTGSHDNIRFLNLKVLAGWWGGGIIGFSDHTMGHRAVLGAVALAARVIEKHFTDDNDRAGPDHKFSMTPVAWKRMTEAVRELEAMLGDGVKKVEENEKETVVLQRRAIYAVKDLEAGEKLGPQDVSFLRPCPPDGLEPYRFEEIRGRKLKQGVRKGDYIRIGQLV